KAAEAWAMARAAELETAPVVTAREPTIGELADEWILVAKGAPSTRADYASHVMLSLRPLLGNVRPSEATIPRLRAFVRELVAQGLARQTCSNRLSTLAKLLSWA